MIYPPRIGSSIIRLSQFKPPLREPFEARLLSQLRGTTPTRAVWSETAQSTPGNNPYESRLKRDCSVNSEEQPLREPFEARLLSQLRGTSPTRAVWSETAQSTPRNNPYESRLKRDCSVNSEEQPLRELFEARLLSQLRGTTHTRAVWSETAQSTPRNNPYESRLKRDCSVNSEEQPLREPFEARLLSQLWGTTPTRAVWSETAQSTPRNNPYESRLKRDCSVNSEEQPLRELFEARLLNQLRGTTPTRAVWSETAQSTRRNNPLLYEWQIFGWSYTAHQKTPVHVAYPTSIKYHLSYLSGGGASFGVLN